MSEIQNERIRKALLLDELSLTKRQQALIKKEYTSSFLQKLEDILERCFLKSKERKELFISKEKLTLEFLQLLQSQKKFKDSVFIHNELCCLAVFDRASNLIGRIKSISVENKTVEFTTLDNLRRNGNSVIKDFSEVDFFDIYTLKMQKYYEEQKKIYDSFKFKDCFELLTGKISIKTSNETPHYSLGRGIPLNKGTMDRINNIDIKD